MKKAKSSYTISATKNGSKYGKSFIINSKYLQDGQILDGDEYRQPTVVLALKYCIEKLKSEKLHREIDIMQITDKQLSELLDELIKILKQVNNESKTINKGT